ncbi:MAG: hypothetical protein L6Q57_05225 [Alphaproteobacteria bacterium]|nr:hypothetical protein [Alphaproteobacteria bacterium]
MINEAAELRIIDREAMVSKGIWPPPKALKYGIIGLQQIFACSRYVHRLTGQALRAKRHQEITLEF